MPTRHDNNEKNICVVVATNNNHHQKLETSPHLYQQRFQQHRHPHRNIVVRAPTKPLYCKIAIASTETTTSTDHNHNIIITTSPAIRQQQQQFKNNNNNNNNLSSLTAIRQQLPPAAALKSAQLLAADHSKVVQRPPPIITNRLSNHYNNNNNNNQIISKTAIQLMTKNKNNINMQSSVKMHQQQICLGPPTNTAARAGRRQDAAVSVVRPVMKLAGDFNFSDLALTTSNGLMKSNNNSTTVNNNYNTMRSHQQMPINGANTNGVIIRELSSQQQQQNITSPAVLNYQQLQDQHQLHQLHQLLLMHQQQQQQQIRKSNDEIKLKQKYDDLYGGEDKQTSNTCDTLSSWLTSSKSYGSNLHNSAFSSSQQNLNDLVIGQQHQHQQQQQMFSNSAVDEPYQQQLISSASLSSLFLNTGGPQQLPLTSTDNCLDGASKSLHNRMLLRKEQELAKLIKRQHALLCQTLQYRRKQLHIIYAIWKSKDFRQAVEQAVLSYEDGLMSEGQQTTCSSSSACIIVDVLSVINLRPTLWTLDICQLLLPPIVNDLLQSKYEYYVQVASQSLQLIVKNFSSVIKTTIQASSSATPSIGVDITREERYNRCLSCCNLLLNARSFVLTKQTCQGKLGKIYRDLAVYMIAALENWPLLVESSERKRGTEIGQGQRTTNPSSSNVALPQINEQQQSKHQQRRHYSSNKIDRQGSCDSNGAGDDDGGDEGGGGGGDDDDNNYVGNVTTNENICVINSKKHQK